MVILSKIQLYIYVDLIGFGTFSFNENVRKSGPLCI